MKTITPQQLQNKIQENEVIILDVRAQEKYELNHIKDTNVHSINIPKTNIFDLDANKDAIASLPKGQEIIVTCTTGNSARKCAAILAGEDFQVTLLEGGITAWNEWLDKNEEE